MTNTTIRNGNLFCLNCGGEFVLKSPMKITDVVKKTDAFNELHKDCEKTWSEPKSDQTKTIEERAIWWLANGETGMSSKTMVGCFMNYTNYPINHPYDPSDFGRCYKLLQVIPEWKSNLYMRKLKKLSIPWKNLYQNWEKLTEMYEENEKKEWQTYKEIGMFEFMQTLIK